MSFADESLMAYVDGELDPQMRAAVAQAVTTDAEVARRVAQHRLLRAALQTAFGAVLEESVPEYLVRAARSGPAGAGTGADQAGVGAGRTAAAARLRRILPLWGAVAASVVVGVVLGARFLGARNVELLAARQGGLVAQGALARALADQLASAPTSNSTVQIGVSFRAHSGEYCRTFFVRASAASGLACHADGWRIEVLARTAAAEGGPRPPAGGALPSAVSQVVDATRDGAPLDAKAERAARDHGWHP